MAYSEQELMQTLGIDSWRNLSKDKMMRFAAMMPDLDTEVALKIVEQFPTFKEFALDTVDEMEKAYSSALKANEQSQDHFYHVLRDIREVLKGELTNEELAWEERKWIIEQLQYQGDLAFRKDSENKRFLDTLLGKVALFGGGALTLGILYLGGRIMFEGDVESPEIEA